VIKYLACLLPTHCCDKVSPFISFFEDIENLDFPEWWRKKRIWVITKLGLCQLCFTFL